MYLHKGEPMVAFQHSMPFGATASVEAWEDVGSIIQDIARNLLHMPIYRYVDDYFCAERPETMLHSMQILQDSCGCFLDRQRYPIET